MGEQRWRRVTTELFSLRDREEQKEVVHDPLSGEEEEDQFRKPDGLALRLTYSKLGGEWRPGYSSL